MKGGSSMIARRAPPGFAWAKNTLKRERERAKTKLVERVHETPK